MCSRPCLHSVSDEGGHLDQVLAHRQGRGAGVRRAQGRQRRGSSCQVSYSTVISASLYQHHHNSHYRALHPSRLGYHRNAACEIIKFSDEEGAGGARGRQYSPEGIRSVALISNLHDEVNIAQFSVLPGCGIIYGTKHGKVRMYMHENRMTE